ncbi:hypothetical protein [Shewanella surugensis]|uniref:Uncharacterized protein n=1 Tax=Shewanella surugensis TaxID=212020 RepID=A0ABT0LEG6_9GAMM|nr:hypothetical protein [Shewanella surugensis]MCL1126083.1 hypothetical protein [Shewanella surugensis]
MEAVAQVAMHQGSYSDFSFNKTDIAIAAVVGAVTGGMGGRLAMQSAKGVLPHNTDFDLKLYHIGPDDMKTEERGRAVNIEMENLSGSVVEGHGLSIPTLSSTQFVMNKGELYLFSNELLTWTLPGSEVHGFQMAQDIYSNTNITAGPLQAQHISEIYSATYCPEPEDIEVDILNRHIEYGQFMRSSAQGRLADGRKVPLNLFQDGLTSELNYAITDLDVLSSAQTWVNMHRKDGRKIVQCRYNVRIHKADGTSTGRGLSLIEVELSDTIYETLIELADYEVETYDFSGIILTTVTCDKNDYCAVAFSPDH